MSVSRQPYTPDAILKTVWRRKWHILLPALVIAAAATHWVRGLPDRYRAHALLLLVSQRVPEAFVRSTVATRRDDRLHSITQQILSRTELERIIVDFDLYRDERASETMEAIVESMRTHDIEIRPEKGDAFRLAFTDDNADVARRVVERLVSLFIVKTSDDRATLAEGTDQFLEAQLEEARGKLIDNEARLAVYRRRHSGALPTQLEANVRGLHNTEMQIQAVIESLNRDRERQVVLERSLKDATLTDLAGARARVAPADPSKLTAAEQLARAEASLEDMQSTLTEQHPDIVAMRQTIADVRKRAAAERARHSEAADATPADVLRRSRVQDLQAELAAVEQQIAQKTAEGERLRDALLTYQRRIEDIPTREAELSALTRDYDTLQQTYRGLLTKKQDSQMAANLERQQIGAQFKVLDPPRLPEQPFAPKRMRLYAIGVLGAVGIGLLFALVLEWLDRGLRTQDDVLAVLGVPVLAAIPVVPGERRVGRAVAVAVVVASFLAGAAALAWRFLA